MKKISAFFFLAMLTACNNEKKDKVSATETNVPANTQKIPTDAPAAGLGQVNYTADNLEIKHSASLLVSKDKDKLKADAPFLCILTSNSASNNNEPLTLNFVFDTKPGNYPVVGSSFMRGSSPNDELFGGIMGGQPKLTSNTVTITECKDLGDNGIGGHKWSISGHWDEITIKAMPVMLMDKSKNHPAEVKIKGSFSNLTFDDNFEEVMEKALDKMKEN